MVNSLCRRDESGELYYTLEYTVQSPNFFRHNLSVYAARWACTYSRFYPQKTCTNILLSRLLVAIDCVCIG